MSIRYRIGVIGGGVIGLASARRLQQDGHRVVLYDPRPASEDAAAWGSAGIIAVDSASPLATPGIFSALPSMLLHHDSPLALRWGHLPGMLPWLFRFLWNARPEPTEHNARVLASLCGEALSGWQALVEHRPAAELLRPGGWVTAFETQRALRAARDDIERRRRHGVHAEWLDAASLRQRVPELGEHVVGGVYFKDAHVCSDPAALLDALAREVETDAGILRPLQVSALLPVDDGVEVIADGEVERFDRVVVAAGARSRSLARCLGDDFPLDTERGYHVMLNGQRGPSLPVMSGEYKFVTTPMTAGTRLAGTSELGGLQRPPDPRRYALLRRQAATLFPGLDTSAGSEWMGFRPTLPDSLPIIGPSPRVPNVCYALGHQHLGLTLAGITARLVADTIAGRQPPIDLAPLRPDRF